MKKILVTGSNGFIGKNLILKLKGIEDISIVHFNSSQNYTFLANKIKEVDFIVHLAGKNRSKLEDDFNQNNFELTKFICDLLVKEFKENKKRIGFLFSSSTKAFVDTPYGKSKAKTEEYIIKQKEVYNLPFYIIRLPNVFGKFCKPNYNSVIATFCHNIINDIPIKIDQADPLLNLIHIDDVVKIIINFVNSFFEKETHNTYLKIYPVYKKKVSEIAKLIFKFNDCRKTNQIEEVGNGFKRLLYSTFISYFKPHQFSYKLNSYNDIRGGFTEILKTKNSGQVSFFSVNENCTRGGHYHDVKNEKFLVLHGKAKFKFVNIFTRESHELIVNSNTLKVVDTVPGWSHNISNIGKGKLLVMIWANEMFDKDNPDTFKYDMS
jgi:UDP-2-acetamido-2,6-beta-L-arabino-hexul-4-ose reductase